MNVTSFFHLKLHHYKMETLHGSKLCLKVAKIIHRCQNIETPITYSPS